MPPPPPSRWWYAVAGIVVLLGFAGMASYMLPRLETASEKLTRLVAPGEIDLTLKDAGTYTVFHEERSVVDGQLFVSDTVAGLRVSVRSASSGQEVPVRPSSITETYTFGSYAGTSVFTFDISEPGDYRLNASYGDGRAEPRVVLAISHNFMADLMTTIFGAIGIVFAAMAAAIVIVVVVAQKRATAARAEKTASE